MADKKVTFIVIKVDLDCEKCRKKIKKVLGKISEIQNQIYDEKANTVTVSVLSCCPDVIKKKIWCKGREAIKSIEIKEPEKPKPKVEDKSKPADTKSDKSKEEKSEKPKEIKQPHKPKDEKTDKPKEVKQHDKPVKPKDSEPPKQVLIPVVPAYPPPAYPPPCYGTPVPYFEPYGRPVYDSWGGGSYVYVHCRRGCFQGRCDCPYESNSACSIM